MGLCFSHSFSDGIYDERNKSWQPQALTTPIAVTTLLSSAKKEQIGPLREDFPSIIKKVRISTMLALFPTMNYIKSKVSKKRNRHKEDGFDLDLTYITQNIIAMALPAERMHGIIRNHLTDVNAFLEHKHGNRYLIFNLCSEPQYKYNKAKFDNRVKYYPFDDHNPPSFEVIKSFCEDVDRWLNADHSNVVAVHCKAGKGRTGTMICCYMLHNGMRNRADEAMEVYGTKRTQDGQGVTIPSQIRYLRYYEQYLKNGLTYVPTPIQIRRIHLKPRPLFNHPVVITIKQKVPKAIDGDDMQTGMPRMDMNHEGRTYEFGSRYKSEAINSLSDKTEFIMHCPMIKTMSGDVVVEFYYRSPLFTKKKRFAKVWINTFFANLNGVNVGRSVEMVKRLTFKKNEIDIVWKEDRKHKQVSEDFELTIVFQTACDDADRAPLLGNDELADEARALEPTRVLGAVAPNEESSGAEEDTEEDDWESVLEKRLSDPPGVGYRILSECEISQILSNGELKTG